MKKTINVNLSGRSFVIDEDAYELLKNYLDTIGNAFIKSPDVKDIVEDIEARISELFTDLLASQSSTIITIENTQNVIEQIGNPSQFDETAVEIDESTNSGEEKISVEETTSYTSDQPLPQPEKVRKRFFRDPFNKMLGGVCSGIAAYLNVDVTWVRLLTAALCFLSFSTVGFVYVILWLVVPEAITPLQRMQMMGEAPTFQNIADTVTKGINQTIQNIPQPNTAGNIFTRILAALGKIIIGFTCGIGIILIVCLVVATIAATVGLIVYYVSGSSSFPSWISGVQSAWWLIRFIWAMLGAIITIGLPIYIIYRLAFGKNWRPGSKTVIKLAFVWVVGIILASTNFNKLEKYNDEKELKVSIEKAIDTEEDDDKEDIDIEDSITSDITLQNQDSIITADSVTSVKTSKTGRSK